MHFLLSSLFNQSLSTGWPWKMTSRYQVANLVWSIQTHLLFSCMSKICSHFIDFFRIKQSGISDFSLHFRMTLLEMWPKEDLPGSTLVQPIDSPPPASINESTWGIPPSLSLLLLTTKRSLNLQPLRLFPQIENSKRVKKLYEVHKHLLGCPSQCMFRLHPVLVFKPGFINK